MKECVDEGFKVEKSPGLIHVHHQVWWKSVPRFNISD